MMLTDRQLSLPAVLRVSLAGVCLLFASVFLLRAIVGGDALGRWSVDRGGRLISDVMGHKDTAQAWVVGDELTITADGTALTFTRR